MSRRDRRVISTAASLVILLALSSGAIPVGQLTPAAATAEERPNIVVFYMDDVSPHDGRLWNDPGRTPNIYHHFIEHGVEFRNAIGESPLCCPGRAGFLSGLHTHNNGVYTNDIRLASPTDNVATALRDAGYATYWLGKYLNAFENVAADEWATYNEPWTALEATLRYQKRVRTRAGWVTTGLHPTQYITNRAAQLIAATPSDQPIFAVLAPFNLHAPNVPAPMPPGVFAKCDSIAPWLPPNYNEDDVSDKPLYVRTRPLLNSSAGWPMVKYCKEMFGIDALVGAVTSKLAEQGRLDNTLLLFTADNGMNWGAHRLGQSKSTPYSTRVPLYASWPARWGDERGALDEYVSNIDLGPTFCDLGGCELGPYKSGQDAPDGVSLLPLLDGEVTNVGRDALLETLADRNASSPAWNAVRTTPLSPLGLWHYVEYETSEKELYNLAPAADPWEMRNLAGDPTYAVVEAALASRLQGLLQEGRVQGPDLSIWLPGTGPYHGYNVFGDAVAAQTESVTGLRAGTTVDIRLQLENNTTSSETFVLHATSSGRPGVRVSFLVDGVDETPMVNGPGYEVALAGAQRKLFVLRVNIKAGLGRGARKRTLLTVQSTHSGATDVSRLIAGR